MKTQKQLSSNPTVCFADTFLPDATGPVTIPMTNDYLFRALLQENNTVLKGLISSLLHLPIEEISSVKITNPIELGKAYNEKDFYLDIKVLLNNDTTINLEMQVINEHNWPERSLSYLCRIYDNLSKGNDYINVMPVIQIGLLDFTLFPEHPEFYATYKLLNVKNYSIYSDKFRLSVVDLTRVDMATEEDKQYGIDHWATLFKSKTWEDIKMLAQNNEYIKTASDTIYKLTQEEQIRQQCEAREEYYRRQRSTQKLFAQRLAELEKKASELEQKISEAEHKASEVEHKASEVEHKASEAEHKLSMLEKENEQPKLELARLKAQNT